jgi:hypothetical protein
MPLEVLNFPLVFFRCFPRIECTQIFPFTLDALLPRIQSEFSVADFSYHNHPLSVHKKQAAPEIAGNRLPENPQLLALLFCYVTATVAHFVAVEVGGIDTS